MKIDTDRWYSANEAAQLLDVTQETVKGYCRSKKLKGKRIGPKKQWYVQGSEILRLITEWGVDVLSPKG